MKTNWIRIALFIALALLQGRMLACNQSSFVLVSQTYNSFTQQYVIQTRLNIGSGRTGVTPGADGATRNILFGFWKTCPALTLYSFTPSQITGPVTGCVMTGTIGTNSNPMNANAYVGFAAPPSCATNGFACISSTVACGPANSNIYNLTFYTNVLPDSIRAFGVEGNGNLFGGCYPNADMKIDFCGSEGCYFTFPITCPGPQTIVAGPNCVGTLPNYSSLATFPPYCPANTAFTVTQSPLAGTTRPLGSSVVVSLFGHVGTFGSSTCTFVATVRDRTGPVVNCPANLVIPATVGCDGILGNYLSLATLADNCDPNPTLTTQHPSPGTVFSGTKTVYLLGQDNLGNVDSCAFMVSTAETVPPTITCPANQTISLNAQCNYLMPDYRPQAVAADNCTAVPFLGQSPTAGTSLAGPGVQTVVLTATDGPGNTATCSFMVTSSNTNTPQVICPTNRTLTLGANCQGILADYRSSASVAYGCAPFTYTYSQNPAPGFPVSGVGSQSVFVTATDNLGGQTTCSFTVNKVDVTPPTISCPGNDTVALDSNCQYVIADFRGLAVIADNCTSTPTVSQSMAPGSIATGVGAAPIYLIATDASGNSASCSFIENCVDRRPPRITCPANTSIVLNANCQATLPNYTSLATASDNCSISSTITQLPLTGTVLTGASVNTITLRASDLSGNTATCSFTVTTLDNIQPLVFCPGNATLALNANCQVAVPNYLSTTLAFDNCPSTPNISQSPTAGSLISGVGSTTVSMIATDASSNTSSCSFLLTRVDQTPPSLTCPANAILALGNNCQATLPNYAAQATAADNCTASPTLSQNPTAGLLLNGAGATTVTLTATDAAGNTSNCVLTVTASDQTPPSLTCPANATIALGNNCQAVLPAYSATATDNCSTPTAFVQSPSAGTVLNGGGIHTVTLSANDAAGNMGTCNFTVSTLENTPPTIVCPANAPLALNANCQVVVPDFVSNATLADNCTASPACTQAPAAGALLTGAGSSTVTLTATDGAGNTASCSLTVTASDQTPPSLTCPANAMLPINAQCQAILPDYTLQASALDNCGPTTLIQSPTAGSLIGGPGVVVLTVTDGVGNTATCNFQVTIADNTPPTLVCPATQTLTLDAFCHVVLPDYRPLASAADNCTALPSMLQSPSAGAVLSAAGAWPVTLSATDASGNVGTCTFMVQRLDLTPPLIICPSSIVLSTQPLDCEVPATWLPPSFSDNCGSAVVQGSHVSGDAFPIGTTVVAYTATDLGGNVASCSFTITVTAAPLDNTIVLNPSVACEGDTVMLSTLPGMASYAWSTGGSLASLLATAGGWYWVDVTAPNQCTARDSFYLSILPVPLPLLTLSGNQVCTGAFSSYQWLLNGVAIPGETGPCTAIATSGNYSVQVTAANGCTGISATMGLVGTAVSQDLGFQVYPVPAQDLLYIQLGQPLDAAGRIVLYDISGKAVRSMAFGRLDLQTEFSLDGLADGSYFLEVRADGFWGMKKVVKLR